MKGNRHIKRSLMIIICRIGWKKKRKKEIFRALTNTMGWIWAVELVKSVKSYECIIFFLYIFKKQQKHFARVLYILLHLSLFLLSVFLPKFYSITMCLYPFIRMYIGCATRFFYIICTFFAFFMYTMF